MLDYASTYTPADYVCRDCGAGGVRLYREYNTFLDHQVLRCTTCALRQQKMERADSEATIGWLVLAVPTEDAQTYWGYTSIPQPGVEWWRRLPSEPTPSPGSGATTGAGEPTPGTGSGEGP